MMRWAVDLTGIDVEADLQREQNKAVSQVPNSRVSRWNVPDGYKPDSDHKTTELGEVHVFEKGELFDLVMERIHMAPEIPSPFAPLPSSSPPPMDSGRVSLARASLPTSSDLDSPKIRTVKVFANFLNSQGKLTPYTVSMTQPLYRGVDVINAFLQQMVAPDEHHAQRFSSNPRLYKLYIADEFTGEEEMAVQLDLAANNFSCYVVSPLPAAKLFLFPQRTELLPMVPDDIVLTVYIRPIDSPQGKTIQRQCTVPADMLAETLESIITRRLPSSGIVQGSLRIKYGPLELNINEYYNFGPGCGQMCCPIAELTVLALYRFGVKDVIANGRTMEEQPLNTITDPTEEIEINMDVEEAMSFQQFEVICINRYGARQQRLLCVDGEHLYTMRPNSSDDVPKTTERMIKDIEEVRLFPDKPKYMEISYTRGSRFEEDHFECTTTYNCLVLDEKLRVVRRELRKKADQSAEAPQETAVQRLMNNIRGKWFRS